MSINVKDEGALGNGLSDDTGAFQSALNKAGVNGDVVFVPAGTYQVLGNLRVPPYVTLEGVWRAPAYSDNYAHQPDKKGTVLLASAGKENINDKPFISLEGHSAGVKGLTIYYPDQGVRDVRPNLRSLILEYPFTIQGGNPGGFSDNITIQDIQLVNSFQGIDLATYRCGRHLIRGVYGQPLRVGIQVDQCLDIGRIEDVHFWPFWRDDAEIKTYTGTHGFALVLRRSDWQIVHNFFALGYHVGILFGHGLNNNFTGGCNGQFSNINFDAADVGLDIYTVSGAGAHFSNLNIACTDELGHSIRCAILTHPQGDLPRGLRIGPLNITNGSFWGLFKNQVIFWEREGPLHLSSSILRHWERGKPAIRIQGGDAIILGNTFLMDEEERVGAGPRNSVEVLPTGGRVIVSYNNLNGFPIICPPSPNPRIIKHNYL
jgi:hypothetical protein